MLLNANLTHTSQPVGRAQFQQTVDLLKKNQSYKLVADEEEEKVVSKSSSSSKKDSEDKKSKRKQHTRKKTDTDQWEDDKKDEEDQEPEQKKQKTGMQIPTAKIMSLNISLEWEDDNEKDLREREEFEDRLRERDEKSTKKVCFAFLYFLCLLCVVDGDQRV